MSNLTEDDLKRLKLGDIGEFAAIETLRNRGHKVEYTKSQFDNKKDLILNDELFLEVKTQVVFFKKNAFSINETQYTKCMNAHGMIFVQTPCVRFPDEHDGAIYAYDQKSIFDNLEEPENVSIQNSEKTRKSYPVKRDFSKIIGNVKDINSNLFDRMKELETSNYGKIKIKEPKEIVF